MFYKTQPRVAVFCYFWCAKLEFSGAPAQVASESFSSPFDAKDSGDVDMDMGRWKMEDEDIVRETRRVLTLHQISFLLCCTHIFLQKYFFNLQRV